MSVPFNTLIRTEKSKLHTILHRHRHNSNHSRRLCGSNLSRSTSQHLPLLPQLQLCHPSPCNLFPHLHSLLILRLWYFVHHAQWTTWSTSLKTTPNHGKFTISRCFPFVACGICSGKCHFDFNWTTYCGVLWDWNACYCAVLGCGDSSVGSYGMVGWSCWDGNGNWRWWTTCWDGAASASPSWESHLLHCGKQAHLALSSMVDKSICGCIVLHCIWHLNRAISFWSIEFVIVVVSNQIAQPSTQLECISSHDLQRLIPRSLSKFVVTRISDQY